MLCKIVVVDESAPTPLAVMRYTVTGEVGAAYCTWPMLSPGMATAGRFSMMYCGDCAAAGSEVKAGIGFRGSVGE